MTLVMERPTTETKPAEEAAKETGGLVIIAWSGEIDRIWPTLILANTAAAMGKPVAIFFTFWGLFPIVKNGRGVTGDHWMQKMLSMMNPGGMTKLKLSKMNFMGMGPSMMRTLAKRNNISDPQELLETARDMGVRLIPCQMTMDMMGLKFADLIDGVEEPVGATTVLALAEGGATTLFI